MLYRSFYYLVNLGLRFFYRRIYVTGMENIEKDKAYLIACNHPAGFMEPLIMACMSPIDLYFLVRGDLFENKLLKPILVGTHQLPIFRFRDGFSSLRQNQQTIDKVIDTLADKKAVMIFAEGSTLDTFGIRPLQKGLGRITFQALEKYPDLDLQILPVGVTFSQVGKISSDVMLNVGKPFPANEFYTPEAKDQPAALTPLLRKTEEAMRELVISETQEVTRPFIRGHWKSLTIKRNEGFLKRVERGTDFFSQLQQNISSGQSPEVMVKETNYISGKRNIWSAMLMPLAAPGYLFMSVPRFVGLTLQKRLVKKIEFKSPITFASALFLALILFLSLLIASLVSFGLIATLISVAGLGLSLLAYACIWENFNK